ncbi:MAG: NAD(P)/FAD-dependent oxidoreductase [Alphaproteobacteria bacterium]|nr:MAG: NAD(P)/FAD-dependent oxidoreductase [Alphaproteobacteria bacterium]
MGQAGRKAVVLEAGDAVGMRWRNHYDRLHLHTARALSGLPGMPMPAHLPRYPARRQVVEYLQSYAERFEIAPRFGTRMQRATGGPPWRVETDRGAVEADNLVMATGFAGAPNRPRWPDAEAFAGRRIHARDYRNPAPFRGRRVLVVGFGNSGGEIALDLVEAGVDTEISVRGPVNVTARDILGLPAQRWTILLSLMPPGLADALTAPIRRPSSRGLAERGLRLSSKGPLRQIAEDRRIPLIDVGTLGLIRAGRLPVRPGIARLNADGAVFADGSTGRYDAIIEATGYVSDLRPLLPGAGEALDAEGRPRDTGAARPGRGLFFCGYQVSAGGQLRQIGFDARAIARAIARRKRHVARENAAI